MSEMILHPYRYRGVCWVFDDQEASLKEEAFVLGASEMISRLVQAKQIPNAEQGFSLSFSDQPFDHDLELGWISAEEAAQAISQPKAACLPSAIGMPASSPVNRWSLVVSRSLRVLLGRTSKDLRQSREASGRRRPTGMWLMTTRRHATTCRQTLTSEFR